jgi:hypothetical protein
MDGPPHTVHDDQVFFQLATVFMYWMPAIEIFLSEQRHNYQRVYSHFFSSDVI